MIRDEWTTLEKRNNRLEFYYGQPTYPAQKIYLYENQFSIHLTLSSPGVFFTEKKTGLQSVPMASQKLLILTGMGNPEMDMAGIQRIPQPGCIRGKWRFSFWVSPKKCDMCGKIVG